MSGRFWTTTELAAVREHYPRGGVEACLPHVQRNRQSIYQRAAAMGLHAPGYSGARERWPNDPELDERIRRLHEHPLQRGAIRDFAECVGRPCWYVSRRARELGLKTPRFREPPWTPSEVQLLHDTAHLLPSGARLTFKRSGYTRSDTAIVVKRKRQGILLTQARNDEGLFNANQLSELLGVDRKTVARWITLSELPGKKRGDLWFIKDRDLREFIITHPFRVELRKIPDSSRAWFIELLGRKAA